MKRFSLSLIADLCIHSYWLSWLRQASHRKMIQSSALRLRLWRFKILTCPLLKSVSNAKPSLKQFCLLWQQSKWQIWILFDMKTFYHLGKGEFNQLAGWWPFDCFQLAGWCHSPASWKQTNISFEAFLVGNQGWCIKGQMLR